MSTRSPLPAVLPPPWACGFGEDEYGIFGEADLGGLRFVFRWVPPGTFMMGSPEDEEGRYAREGPRHEVRISNGFWMGETPVTQEQWRSVMGGNPSRFKGDRRPVESISWIEALEWTRKLNALRPGLRAGLPTEAQWEYSCRAGTEGGFNGGSGAREALDELGWYEANSGGETQDVGRKAPNRWGLHDMHGNVYEWCRDGRREYSGEPEVDPVCSPEESAERCLRGGSWLDLAWNCRSASRDWYHRGFRLQDIGFRLATGQEHQPPEAE